MTLLSDKLVAFWELDESAGTRYDSTGSVNTLTDNNTVTSNPGKVFTAAQFTSANSESLTRASNSTLSMGDIDFSVSAWIYLDTRTANQVVLNKYDNVIATTEYLLFFETSSNVIAWYVYGAGGVGSTQVRSVPTLSATTWYHIYAYHDSVNNVIGVSINNAAADTTPHTTGTAVTNSQFGLGILNVANVWFMDGRLDQIGIWKRLLTTAERTALYNAGAGLSFAQMVTPNLNNYKFISAGDGMSVSEKIR